MTQHRDEELQRRWAPTLGAAPSEPAISTTDGAVPHADKWPSPTSTAREQWRLVGDTVEYNGLTTGGHPMNFTYTYSTSTGRSTWGGSMQPTPSAVPEKAFVTTINGKTFVSAPANARTAREMAIKDPTVEEIADAHLLWLHGRFVGADEPNRNGAMWSAGDLELSASTAVNGPLNWLHEARHVIGTLAGANYVNKETAAGENRQPHLTATAAIWKWLWPDEAYVIQQASEQNHLWYSMECISREVTCSGPNGCGNTTSYSDYMAGGACEHVRERSASRHFVNPVFLGGAVIVPPTRPGWAEADARVMQEATGLAEAAYEQAGRPDVPAAQWEQMMAQLVRFAQK